MTKRLPRISVRKRNLLLKRFIREDTAKQAALAAGVSRMTANKYFRHYREKIYEHFYMAPRFNGEVEMDQAFFGKGIRNKEWFKKSLQYGDPDYKPTFKTGEKQVLKMKRKHIQVFGILKRKGEVYTHIIEKADRNTLFPIIHMIVEPGTTIFTDKWTGFNGLEVDGYIHKPVNHSEGFVGKDGAHTAGVE